MLKDEEIIIKNLDQELHVGIVIIKPISFLPPSPLSQNNKIKKPLGRAEQGRQLHWSVEGGSGKAAWLGVSEPEQSEKGVYRGWW